MTGVFTPSSEAGASVEPTIPVSVEALGVALIEAIEATELVHPGVVDLVDASTDPTAIASSETILTILEVTTADDSFAEPAIAIGLVSTVTGDTLSLGLADPLTGELFAVGISSDLVIDGSSIGTPIPDSEPAPVYITSVGSDLDLAVFIISDLSAELPADTPAILERGVDVLPEGTSTAASFSASASPWANPSAQLAADFFTL